MPAQLDDVAPSIIRDNPSAAYQPCAYCPCNAAACAHSARASDDLAHDARRHPLAVVHVTLRHIYLPPIPLLVPATLSNSLAAHAQRLAHLARPSSTAAYSSCTCSPSPRVGRAYSTVPYPPPCLPPPHTSSSTTTQLTMVNAPVGPPLRFP